MERGNEIIQYHLERWQASMSYAARRRLQGWSKQEYEKYRTHAFVEIVTELLYVNREHPDAQAAIQLIAEDFSGTLIDK